MSRGGRGGGGWSDEPDWVRPMPRGGSGRPTSRMPPPDYDDPWGGPVRPRGRSAIHDPWGGGRGRGMGLPFRMPNPMVLGGIGLFLFAFLLGRCTAPGDGGGGEVATTNTTLAATTTSLTLPPIIHTVKEKETLALIASRYGVTINDIAIANNIGDQNNIFVGQQLKIPQGPVATTTTSTTVKKNKK